MRRLHRLCMTVKGALFARPSNDVLAVGRRYLMTLVRAQRLLPGDPRLQRLREQYEQAERAMLGEE